MILKNFLFLKMIIIIYQTKLVLSIEIECNEYKDCFNCSICAKEETMTCKCEWDPILKQCTNSSFLIKNADWKNYYKNCNDDLSKLIQQNYCGDFQKTKNKFTLTLPEINNYFGSHNLYCYYILHNNKNPKTNYEIKINQYESDIKIDYIINFNDENISYLSANNDNFKPNFSKVKYIEFHIYIKEIYTKSPFEIEITMKDYTKKFVIIIIVIVVFFIIICGTSIYFFTKNLSVINFDENNQNDNNPSQNNEIKKKENESEIIKKKINFLLNRDEFLGSKICKKEYEKYGSTCSICLEELCCEKDYISLTPCFHIFHYKCLSEYMRKSIKNIHCPNCNLDLLESFEFKDGFNKLNNIINPQHISVNNRRNVNLNLYTNDGNFSISSNRRFNDSTQRNNNNSLNTHHNENNNISNNIRIHNLYMSNEDNSTRRELNDRNFNIVNDD